MCVCVCVCVCVAVCVCVRAFVRAEAHIRFVGNGKPSLIGCTYLFMKVHFIGMEVCDWTICLASSHVFFMPC